MRTLTLQSEGDWVVFRTGNSTFIKCLRSGITPHSYRKYDAERGLWFVWWEKLPDLVELARRFYGTVDRSSLPDAWQYAAAGAKVNQASGPSKSPYTKLHLTDDAPIEVVRAAYQVLITLYHPDHNDGVGDMEKLNQVIDSYKEIKKLIRKI